MPDREADDRPAKKPTREDGPMPPEEPARAIGSRTAGSGGRSPGREDRADRRRARPSSAERRARRRRVVRRRRAVLALVVILILLVVTIVLIVRGCGSDGSTASKPSPGASTYAPDDRWWPLIQTAAEKNGVDPVGMHKMMLLESDGREGLVTADQFYGLYQYVEDTWNGEWNPWRDEDMLDGRVQIKATALALKNGKGPYWWPNTYDPAFGE